MSTDRPHGRFLVVSGLKFWWDPTGAVGSRVGKIEVMQYPEATTLPLMVGEAILPFLITSNLDVHCQQVDRDYEMILPKFLFGGGDG